MPAISKAPKNSQVFKPSKASRRNARAEERGYRPLQGNQLSRCPKKYTKKTEKHYGTKVGYLISYLEKKKKMSADDICTMLSKEYPSIEVFKDFFNWYKSCGLGFLHPDGEPTTTTCLNTFHSILGYIKNETGKSMTQAQCDDIHTFIKYHLGVQDIKKPKYVADSYVIEQMIQYWWSHDHVGYNPISFPLALQWLTYLVSRPGSIFFTPEYQNGLRYKHVKLRLVHDGVGKRPKVVLIVKQDDRKNEKGTSEYVEIPIFEQPSFWACGVTPFLAQVFADNALSDAGSAEELFSLYVDRRDGRVLHWRPEVLDWHIFRMKPGPGPGLPFNYAHFGKVLRTVSKKLNYDAHFTAYSIRTFSGTQIHKHAPTVTSNKAMGHANAGVFAKFYHTKLLQINTQNIVLYDNPKAEDIDWGQFLRPEKRYDPDMHRYPLKSNLIPQSMELVGDLRKCQTLDYILRQRFDPDGQIVARAAENTQIFDITDGEFLVLGALVRKCAKKENDIYYPDEHPRITDGVPFCPVCDTDLTKIRWSRRGHHIHQCISKRLRGIRSKTKPRYCYRCSQWLTSSDEARHHDENHFAELDSFCGLEIHDGIVLIDGRCPFCLGKGKMTHFTNTQYFRRHLREELEHFDGSCPHPRCAGQSGYIDVESFATHLKDTHGIQNIFPLTQEEGQEQDEEPSLLHDKRPSLDSGIDTAFANVEAVTEIKPSSVQADIIDSFIDWPSPAGLDNTPELTQSFDQGFDGYWPYNESTMPSQQSGLTTPDSIALGLEATHFALATFGLGILEDLTFPKEREYDNDSSFPFFEKGSQNVFDSESSTAVATPEFTFCTTTTTDGVNPLLQSLLSD